MEYSVQLQKLCQIEARKYILIVGMVAITYLMLQPLILPKRNAPKSGFSSSQLLSNSAKESENSPSNVIGVVKQDDQSNGKVFIRSDNGLEEMDRSTLDLVVSDGEGEDEAVDLIKDENKENESSYLKFDGLNRENSSMSESNNTGHVEQIVGLKHQTSLDRNLGLEVSSSSDVNRTAESWNRADLVPLENVEESDDLEVMAPLRRKEVGDEMPPTSVTTIAKMNQMLAQHLSSSSKMKSQGTSLHHQDKEIVDAKLKIKKGAVLDVDKALYAPVFRNVSIFMRSYELMEKTLKVYVYRDGKKPIFHQPILKGLYASEGWFMKLMERSKQFLVKNPEKAHLFYMPFSSRMLEYALYVPNSHNQKSLRQFVKEYKETIAAKYPFWNRTGGTDHFLVACHDWAPYETKDHMENNIKALCNADITIGFKIGKDVSLPETLVRYARNPLRNLGGKPPSKRNILAFYAGNRHGYLRPILLKYWKDKDPSMRIYGQLPTSVSRKMNYIQHMKSSKYCICPKGYEVNSPRVVEAIFYECVPVIISDNFVPPFFEILNWEAFSVIVAEKDIPNLKDILLSIPEEKYIEMQLAVTKVQQHFLWHARPVKYDLFHMILHSVWYSRVFQVQT